MKCPNCGHDMGKSSKCLRCGYTVKAIIPVDAEKIEQEKEEPTKVIHADQVKVSRASDSIFGSIFGSDGFFGGGIGGIFDSLFGGFSLCGEDEDEGYTYDPNYYDDFGNEIEVPDEFERDSVEIDSVELMEDEQKSGKKKNKKKHDKE